MLNVYIDNDVFIRASKDRPLPDLTRAALQGQLQLYTSLLAYVEYDEWPTKFRERYRAAFEAFRRTKTPETIAAVNRVHAEMKSLEASKKSEWDYWAAVPFRYPESTFEGLLAASTVSQDMVSVMDTKGEIALYGKLREVHRIESTDAQHLMIAHSAELTAVLTWDKRLIKKAASVAWLKPRVVSPDTFLERYE